MHFVVEIGVGDKQTSKRTIRTASLSWKFRSQVKKIDSRAKLFDAEVIPTYPLIALRQTMRQPAYYAVDVDARVPGDVLQNSDVSISVRFLVHH